MSSFFHNKVVAITGGSDGIGRALVDELIALGAKIATCGRNYEKLYNLQLEYSHLMLHTVVCDVSIETDCKKFIESTIKTFGGIDILINNAGISMRGEFEETDASVIKRLMDINFMGAVYCTKYALPSIIERKGIVVGVSSIAGYRGLPGRSGYSASKFALQGWLETLRTEMLRKDVHVMWVCPGFTTSNIRNTALNQEGVPQKENPLDENSLMPAKECARYIAKAIEQKKRTLVLTFMGKLTRFMNKWFPAFTDKMTYKYYYKEDKLIQ